MANTTVETVPDPTYKTPVEPVALIIGTIFGTLFLAFALVDFSVLHNNIDAFATQYFLWKSQAPIVKPIITILTLTVPLAVIEITMNLFHLVTKKATLTRHICDVLHFIAFTLVIYTGIVYTAPLEESILMSLSQEEFPHAFTNLQQLYYPALANVILNTIMLFLPIIKYLNQLSNPIPMIPKPSAADSKKND